MRCVSKPLQVRDIWSHADHWEKVGENALLEEVARQATGQSAYAYALLDHAVALGRYERGQVLLGLGREHLTQEEVPVAYLRELRVFDTLWELRAVRMDKGFCLRLRVDGVAGKGKPLQMLEETHKLWGSCRGVEYVQSGWSLLRSERGSAFWFPGEIMPHGEKGVRVRNYIEFPCSLERNNSPLMYFVDERLCGFADWPPEERCEREETQHDGLHQSV